MTKILLSVTIIALFISAPLFSQEKTDLSGTWTGGATFDNRPDMVNEISMVIAQKEGKLTGEIFDEFNSLVDTPVKNIKFEKGILTFDTLVMLRGEEQSIKFKMTVKGMSMEGTITVPELDWKGKWKANKQKKK